MKTSSLLLLAAAGVGGFYLYRSTQVAKQSPASTGASSGAQSTVGSLWNTVLKGVSTVINQYTTGAGGDNASGPVDYSGGVSHGADGSTTAVATADGSAAISDAFDLQRYAGIGQTPETLTTREQAAIGGTLTNSYYATA